MRYTELTETTRNLGGFNVKVIASVPSGPEQEVNEGGAPVTHRIGLTVTDPNHPMVSKRKETIQKTVRVKGDDREKAINGAIAHYRRKGYKVHDHHYMGTVDDEIKEFASPGSGDDGNDGFSDETLKRMAAQWWQGDEDPRIEKTLMAAGWEIGQDEGYDNGGVFVVQAGDVKGNSYMSWPAEELEQGLAEGWKDKLGAAALAGSMALGAGAAHGRVTPDGQGGFTGGLKPSATVTAPADNKPAAEAPKGFSKEYLQKAADPNRFGRYLISVEKAQELLKGMQEGVAEAIKLDAPQKKWSNQDMQDYLTRVKTGTKTKQDRFKPIIHGSNVKAITKDDGGEEWDLADLARQITTRPRAILGSNAKMSKSKAEGAITYDLTLPALSGIVVDEETGEFVEIVTCPGAGECQLYCYARKGGYVMFPASSMSAAQALNFLVNHPEDYMKMFDSEVKKTKGQADKHGIRLLVRIHDAGDFFSKDYYNLMMDVARNNQDVKFYFYTKMGELATDSSAPPNVVSQFSPGAKSREVKTVQVTRDAGKHVKDAVTLPKDMFRELFVTDAKGKYVKDEKGRTQVKSEADWNQFKQKLADVYKLDPDTIITYDQMNRIPEGPKPKWNVVIFPAGHGDLGASRLDVSKQFLMFH